MNRSRTRRTIEREQWFADIVAALGEAEKLLTLIDRDGDDAKETGRLRQRIHAVRAELSLLSRIARRKERILPGNWPQPVRGDEQ